MTIGRWRKKSFCESYAFIKQKRPFRQMKGTLSHCKSIAFALLPKLCLILSDFTLCLLHAFLVFFTTSPHPPFTILHNDIHHTKKCVREKHPACSLRHFFTSSHFGGVTPRRLRTKKS